MVQTNQHRLPVAAHLLMSRMAQRTNALSHNAYAACYRVSIGGETTYAMVRLRTPRSRSNCSSALPRRLPIRIRRSAGATARHIAPEPRRPLLLAQHPQLPRHRHRLMLPAQPPGAVVVPGGPPAPRRNRITLPIHAISGPPWSAAASGPGQPRPTRSPSRRQNNPSTDSTCGRPAPLSTHTSSPMPGSSNASATATTSGKTTASRPTIRHHSRSPPGITARDLMQPLRPDLLSLPVQGLLPLPGSVGVRQGGARSR